MRIKCVGARRRWTLLSTFIMVLPRRRKLIEEMWWCSWGRMKMCSDFWLSFIREKLPRKWKPACWISWWIMCESIFRNRLKWRSGTPKMLPWQKLMLLLELEDQLNLRCSLKVQSDRCCRLQTSRQVKVNQQILTKSGSWIIRARPPQAKPKLLQAFLAFLLTKKKKILRSK